METATPLLFGFPLEYVVFAGILLAVLISAPVVLSLSGHKSKISRRAAAMHKRTQHKSSSKTDSSESQKAKSLRVQEGDSSLPLLTALFSHLPNIKRLRDRIAQSGLAISAERYLALNLLLFALSSMLFIVVLDYSVTVSFLVAIVIGLGLPHMVLGFCIGRRTKRFLLLFPDAIDLIVRGLRAGLPVTESIKMVSKEIGEPVGTVFRNMTEKMALGVPLEKTLYDTAAKYRITEFDFFVTSIVLQRETGGNLSEILNNLSEALRQRLMMRMKIKAMSSEAKASMYIISALPFMVVAALAFVSPDYLNPLFDDFRGNIALLIAGGMLSTGVFIMVRMTKFEI